MLRYEQPGISGQSVAFSPYFPDVLACVGGQHYGIAGQGQLSVLTRTPGGIVERNRLDWSDGLFDCTWSEENENHVVTAAGDGSLQLWDLGVTDRVPGPIKVFKGHGAEAVSVHWNQTRLDSTFLSGSWDHTIHLWNPAADVPVASFSEHLGLVYQVVWSPRKPGVFASVSGDGTLKVWDVRGGPHAQQTFRAHETEVLSCDWNKYNENIVVTSSVDRTIRGFDVRAGPGSAPLFVLQGHGYAVRRVKCSPHSENIIASCSYDLTTRLWDTSALPGREQVQVFKDHTEFVIGLDFNLHVPGELVDCAWDDSIVIRQV